ncbi:hypothetical protein ACWD6Q_35060 [Streptomyces nigra]
MKPTRPAVRHLVQVHYHGLTPGDSQYPQVLDVLATITARAQALPPDAAVADPTGAERYFERGPEGLTQLIRLRTLAWTGVVTTIGAGSSRIRLVRRFPHASGREHTRWSRRMRRPAAGFAEWLGEVIKQCPRSRRSFMSGCGSAAGYRS